MLIPTRRSIYRSWFLTSEPMLSTRRCIFVVLHWITKELSSNCYYPWVSQVFFRLCEFSSGDLQSPVSISFVGLIRNSIHPSIRPVFSHSFSMLIPTRRSIHPTDQPTTCFLNFLGNYGCIWQFQGSSNQHALFLWRYAREAGQLQSGCASEGSEIPRATGRDVLFHGCIGGYRVLRSFHIALRQPSIIAPSAATDLIFLKILPQK